jgi:hypothetical protein
MSTRRMLCEITAKSDGQPAVHQLVRIDFLRFRNNDDALCWTVPTSTVESL